MEADTAACPVCSKPVPVTDPPPVAFPFCCRRCRLIDAGRWADGAYAIPAPLTIDDIDDVDWTEHLPDGMLD